MLLTEHPLLNSPLLGVIALALAGLLAVSLLILWVQTLRWQRRYRRLLGGQLPDTAEELFLTIGMRLEKLEQAVNAHQADLSQLQGAVHGYVQHVGIVRFQAFPETGSDLSFAIALLDGDANGVVISSLYGRTESRIYAKPIRGGTSTYPLSDEERQAIARALGETAKPR